MGERLSARYEDSAMGWAIYRKHDGAISLDELNQALQARGFRPVANRSMSHYRKLMRLGYDEYVSMNRLDLRHASESVFDIIDRSRYEDVETQIEATLHIPTARKLEVLVVAGVLTRVSEGFATFRAADKIEDLGKASRSTKYNRGVLTFATTGIERAVEIAEAIEIDDSVEVLLTFRSLLSADVLFPDRVGRSSRSRLTLGLGDDPTLHEIVLSIHRSFDLFESLRGLVETLLTEIPENDERPILPAPRVQSLHIGSPMIQELAGSPYVWILVLVVVNWAVERAKGISEIAVNIEERRRSKRDDDRAQERHEAEIRSQQLANIRDELELWSLIEALGPKLPQKYADQLADIEGLDQLPLSPRVRNRLESFKRQALEAATELTLGTKGLKFEELDDDESDDDEDSESPETSE